MNVRPSLKFSLVITIVLAAVVVDKPTCHLVADDRVVHTFDRQRLTDVYYSEGANAGDLNGDGVADDPQGKRQGVIAFQLHSGGKTEVRFRNLSLKVLDPEAKSVPSE